MIPFFFHDGGWFIVAHCDGQTVVAYNDVVLTNTQFNPINFVGFWVI